MKSAIITSILPTCIILIYHVIQIEGHGRLVEPPSRSSMWRYGFQTPINYDDNQLFCGGYDIQWHQNGGRCGVCGDPYNGRRENEAGGKYATGTISRHYSEGQTITVTLDITTNHGGYFEFRICPNNNPSRPVTESCLNMHLLRQPNGQTQWHIPEGTKKFSLNLVLPRGLTCSQCVMQWKWNTASNWDCDSNNNCCKGCGPQEQFYGCADVSIRPSSGSSVYGNLNNAHSGFGGVQIAANMPNVNNMNNAQSGFGGVQIAANVPNVNNMNNAQNGFGGVQIAANVPNVNSMNNAQSGFGGLHIGANVPGASVSGFIPIGDSNQKRGHICEATAAWKTRYIFADQWCKAQCLAGNCPVQYCKDSCRY